MIIYGPYGCIYSMRISATSCTIVVDAHLHRSKNIIQSHPLSSTRMSPTHHQRVSCTYPYPKYWRNHDFPRK